MLLRVGLGLCLFVSLLYADSRKEARDAQKKLLEADFEELEPSTRERLFGKLCGYDHPEALPGVIDVVSHYGAYIDWCEVQIRKWEVKLRKVNDRQILSAQEQAFRSSWERSLQKEEQRHKQALSSFEVIITYMGRYEQDKTLRKAVLVMPKHDNWRVRYVFASVCGKWHKSVGDASWSKRFFSQLRQMKGDQAPRVRVAVARALGEFKRTDSFELLKLYIRDKDWRVRSATIDSLRQSKSDEACGVLIEAMRKEKGRLLDDINDALQEMTGQDHSYPDIWAHWWHDVGKRIPANKGEAEQAAVRGEDANRFYGIITRSKRILYVIDVSGSMDHPVDPLKRETVITGRPAGADDGPAPGKTRLEVAQNELKRAVRNLPSDAYFNIIFFSHGARLWKPKMTKASLKEKKAAQKDIDQMKAAGSTYTLGALREAFNIARGLGPTVTTGSALVDTVFLLSDGAPTDHKYEGAKLMDAEPILEAVRTWNKDLKITIHTIAVDVVDNYFLRMLAAENGGQFVERK